MKNLFFTVFAVIAMSFSSYAVSGNTGEESTDSEVPRDLRAYGKGSYKGHSVNAGVTEVDCNWAWWNICWRYYSDGLLTVGPGEITLGNYSTVTYIIIDEVDGNEVHTRTQFSN
tara:strand:+ start:41518 stop:41859 length:342 start_codon:yes stop_codon:yes gene_type:complete